MQIVLFVGTKLEIIVAKMAMQLANNNTVIRGTPLVQPDNNLFWFKRPQLVLTLLHFTLFMVNTYMDKLIILNPSLIPIYENIKINNIPYFIYSLLNFTTERI